MKKTVSIHLGRQLFIVEEDAFDRIHVYLKKLEISLSGEEGVSEIIEDIELRLAELLISSLGDFKKVVTLLEVNQAIASLGEPEEFSQDAQQVNFQADDRQDEEQPKRLFRDKENEKIAGVASGLAAYFGLDPVIVRVLFVIFLFLGFGFAVYIVLWIVMPETKTPADRLQMQGKKVNVDNLKEEFERSSEKFKSGAKMAGQRVKQEANRFATRLNQTVGKGIRIFGLIGMIIVLISLLVFTPIALGWIDIIPVTGDHSYISIRDFYAFFYPTGSSMNLAWYGTLLFAYSLAFLLLISGYTMYTGFKNSIIKVANSLLGILTGVGVVMIVFGSIQMGRDYELSTSIQYKHIELDAPELIIDELPLIIENRVVADNDGLDFIWLKNQRIVEEDIVFKFRKSNDSLFHVYQQFSARGIDVVRAQQRASNIHHDFELTQNKMLVDPYYSYPVKDKIRNQKVELMILIPDGKDVFVKGEKIHLETGEYAGEFSPNEEFELNFE